MAGIKPQERKKPAKLSVSIDPDIAAEVKDYARFLNNSDLGYTVQELLRAQMARDPKFQKFLAEARSAPVSVSAPTKMENVKKGAAA